MIKLLNLYSIIDLLSDGKMEDGKRETGEGEEYWKRWEIKGRVEWEEGKRGGGRR